VAASDELLVPELLHPMLALRICCALVTILFGIIAIAVSVLAIWFDLHDHNYALSVLLACVGLFSGLIAVESWKLARSVKSTG
jgi:hypothetical protein